MPTQTFFNLNTRKQQRIEDALLKEFSEVPLADAQVAPIVKNAKIARGAFYKYFKDLTDAYRFELGRAVDAIHHPTFSAEANQSSDEIVAEVKAFLTNNRDNKYHDLIRLHYLTNQYYLPDLKKRERRFRAEPTDWAASILIHEAIRQSFADPDCQNQALENLRKTLACLKEAK